MAEVDDWITPADEADDWITPPDEAVSTAPQASAGVSVNVSPDRLARKSLVPIPQPRPPEAPQAPAADDWLAPREPVPFTAQSAATPSLIPPEPAAPSPAPTAQSPESTGLPLANFDRFQSDYQPQNPNAPLTQGIPPENGWEKLGEAFKSGFGEQPLGLDPAKLVDYPNAYALWQPFVAPLDFAFRSVGALPATAAAAARQIYKSMGASDTEAGQLEREITNAGNKHLIEGPMGSVRPHGVQPAERPLSAAEFLSRVDAVDNPELAKFQTSVLREYGGYSQDVLDKMTIRERQAAYQSWVDSLQGPKPGAPRSPPPEPGPKRAGTPEEGGAGGEQRALPAPEAEQPAEPAPAVDIKVNPPTAETSETAQTAALRAYGYTDDQIAAMSPRQRAAEYKDAIEAGVVPKGAESALSGEPPSNEGAKSVEADDWITPGTRAAPVYIKSAEDVSDAAAAGDQDHTPAQGEANNAQRGHAKWQGLDITFEAPAGGVRRGLTPEGETWEQGFAHAHGYIKGTKGADGDALDISFGDHPDTATEAYVVNERDAKTGRFRQTKSFAGFNTEDEAVQAYLGMEGKTREMIRDVVPMPVAEFKDWVKNGDHSKPVPVTKTDVPVRDHVTSEIAKHEITDAKPEDVDRAAGYVRDEGMDPVDAYDRAVMEAINEQKLLTPEQQDTIGIKDTFDALASAEAESRRPSTLDERQDGVAPGEGEGSALRGPDGETGERAGAPDEQRPADQGNEHAAPVAEGAGRAEGLTSDQIVDVNEKVAPATKPTVPTENIPTKDTSAGTLPEGFKVRARKQTNGGETFSLYQKGKGYVGTYPTEAEAIAAASKPAEKPKAANATLADSFAEHFAKGEGFTNILQARRFAQDATGESDAKVVEEALEFGLVKAAREIAKQPDAFAKLVDLYSRQPRLGTRTSTSMRDQAFSTPVPLAYAAARLARITKNTSVFEPTAGNGALLITANPEISIANEINPERATNLKAQGFLAVTNKDATELKMNPTIDRVIANPPFGAVIQEGNSHVYDLSDIQPGYKTTQIDRAVALRSLAAMRNNGNAVLILGGLPKTATSEKARSDGYNGKAKREFYKTLYDRYNVVDHFTVAGELYERQGAGWPVDVIVIDGRGKSSRKLPAVDIPRVYRSWDELGGLLDAPRGNEGVADRPTGVPAEGAAVGDVGVREPSRGNGLSDTQPGSDVTGEVQPGSDRGNAANGRPGNADQVRPANGGEPGGSGDETPAVGRPLGLADFDSAFDAALEETFGPTKAAAPAAKLPRAPRTTKQVAKSAAQNISSAADSAMSGLVELFGGDKVGSGPSFDSETYAKAKPLFEQASTKFAEFAKDVVELVRRMVGEMQRIYGLTREALERMRPYLKKFIADVQDGKITLGTKAAEEPRSKPTPAKQEQETERQVAYHPASTAPGLGTLVPVNMRTSIADSLNGLEKRVGNLLRGRAGRRARARDRQHRPRQGLHHRRPDRHREGPRQRRHHPVGDQEGPASRLRDGEAEPLRRYVPGSLRHRHPELPRPRRASSRPTTT
jgi:hypothetical protein